MIRINVQTPFSESGSSLRKREGWPVRPSMTVQEVKDEIARGDLGEEERWERDGMRLVWQGRIVRDEETIDEVIGSVSIRSGSVIGVLSEGDSLKLLSDSRFSAYPHLPPRRPTNPTGRSTGP